MEDLQWVRTSPCSWSFHDSEPQGPLLVQLLAPTSYKHISQDFIAELLIRRKRRAKRKLIGGLRI